MRVHFTVDGGVEHFPGLARPVWVDTRDLPPEEAEILARKLREARPYGRSSDAAIEDVPDARRYTVTIEEESGHEETLGFREPAADPSVSELLAELRRYRTRSLDERYKEIDKGVYIVEGAVPRAGTKLTHELIASDFRFLNRKGPREDSEH